MDKAKLVDKMRRNGDTNASLAAYLEITPQSLSMKKNRSKGTQFTMSEIAAIKKRYSLTAKDIDAIFFAE